MYGKFLVIMTVAVVIAFTATIVDSTTTANGQNQIINLTALLTPDANNDNDNDTATTTTTATIPINITATNNTRASNATITISNVTSTNNLTIEDAKQLYLSIWNQTEFNSTFSTFVEPFSTIGYGVYEERSNIFAPGETIVLYVEPVGFAHKQIIDKEGRGNNNTTLYLMNMTADYKIAAANGTELQLIEDVQVGNITSHRPNTEMFLTLTLTPEEQSLPIGSYAITYSVTDEVSGESFDLEKDITVAERK